MQPAEGVFALARLVQQEAPGAVGLNSSHPEPPVAPKVPEDACGLAGATRVASAELELGLTAAGWGRHAESLSRFIACPPPPAALARGGLGEGVGRSEAPHGSKLGCWKCTDPLACLLSLLTPFRMPRAFCCCCCCPGDFPVSFGECASSGTLTHKHPDQSHPGAPRSVRGPASVCQFSARWV